MGNNLSDQEKMNMVIESLQTNPTAFAKSLGFRSVSTVHHITKGRNNISDGMIDKIINRFHNVNYNFLKKAELPVLLDKQGTIEQESFFNLITSTDETSIDYNMFKRFIALPDKIDRIEELLNVLVNQKKDSN